LTRERLAPGTLEERRRHDLNREFVLRDPDGYNLAFFQKK
jgi:hypothetical protein